MLAVYDVKINGSRLSLGTLFTELCANLKLNIDHQHYMLPLGAYWVIFFVWRYFKDNQHNNCAALNCFSVDAFVRPCQLLRCTAVMSAIENVKI